MMGSLLGAMANKGSHTDPMAMAAMMNGNQWMNNPFIYLVFLMMFGNGGWLGNRNGNQVQDAEIQAKLNQLSTQMQDGNETESRFQRIDERFSGMESKIDRILEAMGEQDV